MPRTAALGGGGSPGAGGRDLLAPRLELGAQLAQALLTLAGQLLQLHQLLLDVVQVGRQIASQLRLTAFRSELSESITRCWI